MLYVVNLALKNAQHRLLRRQHQVDRSSVSTILPGLSAVRKEALKAPFVHELDDRVRFPLSLRQYLISTPQLVITVEVASDYDVKARTSSALRGVYRFGQQTHRYVQRRSIAAFDIHLMRA
jgi:hypothetical protein